ncbi:MAG: TonB-dependent receptor [Brachymonas sp.]|nr:TonB-dependent receptor [Brachymonas sp.]
MRFTLTRISAATALLCVALAAQAQQATAPAAPPVVEDEMLPVVVTASKLSEPQKNVTQKVTVVTQEEFAQTGTPNRNAAELLKREPGMFVNALSRNDANWGSYGGLGPKYNGMLLDGMPIDSFVDPMAVDAMAFDRVESQRGPASVMYGNYMSMDFAGNQSPLAGISNYVLKDRIDERATSLGASYGSFNTITGRAYHQGNAGNFHYFVGGSYERSDYTGYGMPHSWLDTTKDPAYRKGKIYGKGTVFLGRDDHSISLFGNYSTHKGDTGRPNRDFSHRYGLLNFTYANQITDTFGMTAKVGLRDYSRYWSEDNYPANLSWNGAGRVKQRIVPADLTFNWKHGNGGLLTFGADAQWVDYKTESISPTHVVAPGNDMKAKSYGLFVQERMVLGDWVLRAGGRFSRTTHDYKLISGGAPGLASQSWNKFLWSAGARYNFSSAVAFYANAGSSFTPPSAKSVGGTLLASDLGVAGRNGQLPNASLKPESGLAFDLGVDTRPMQGMSLGARLFMNQVKDAIVTNVVSQNPSQSRDVNAGKARSQGIELSLKHQVNEQFGYFANTTFTRTKITNPLNPGENGSQLTFVPDNVSNLGFSWKLPFGTEISSYVQYTGRFYDSTDKTSRKTFGKHATVNLHVSHDIKLAGGTKVNVYADFNNIGNKKFEQPWQFRDVGFNATIGAQVRF